MAFIFRVVHNMSLYMLQFLLFVYLQMIRYLLFSACLCVDFINSMVIYISNVTNGTLLMQDLCFCNLY